MNFDTLKKSFLTIILKYIKRRRVLMSERRINHNVMKNKNQLFISWSGEIGKEAANLIYGWISKVYKDAHENIFLSTRIEPGRQGFEEIKKHCKAVQKEFFL